MTALPAAKLDPIAAFEAEKAETIATYPTLTAWQDASNAWLKHAFQHRYMYHFGWMGRPIIQLPTDMVAFQEIVWQVKPDLIIETGIAHGGSLILSASLLAMLDYCDAVETGTVLDPAKPKRRVLGVDIDIRAHNRAAIEAHPMAGRISMLQGSSIDAGMVAEVKKFAEGYKKVLVCLDSNHTHDHVLAELNAYAPLVNIGSYCLVFDTIVEYLPDGTFPDRPWAQGNNPHTAVQAFLRQQKTNHSTLKFDVDYATQNKLMLTVAPNGFLKRIT